MGILCVFCVYDTIGNRCFEKTSFPKIVHKHIFNYFNNNSIITCLQSVFVPVDLPESIS